MGLIGGADIILGRGADYADGNLILGRGIVINAAKQQSTQSSSATTHFCTYCKNNSLNNRESLVELTDILFEKEQQRDWSTLEEPIIVNITIKSAKVT